MTTYQGQRKVTLIAELVFPFAGTMPAGTETKEKPISSDAERFLLARMVLARPRCYPTGPAHTDILLSPSLICRCRLWPRQDAQRTPHSKTTISACAYRLSGWAKPPDKRRCMPRHTLRLRRRSTLCEGRPRQEDGGIDTSTPHEGIVAARGPQMGISTMVSQACVCIPPLVQQGS